MHRVLLINPPLYFDEKGEPNSLDISVPPLGLLYLATYINYYSDQFRAEVVDVGAEKLNLKKIKDRVLKDNYFAVGITAMTPQLQGAVELAKIIKNEQERLSNFFVGSFRKPVKIFLGGPHVSAEPDFVRRFNCFDYAILGEAEKTFLSALNKLSYGQAVARVQRAEPIENLDNLPFPDKKLIKRHKYKQAESILFSRGCPFKCYFCSRPAISRQVRYRSVNNLIEEIKLNYSQSHGWLDFQDDTLTLNRSRVVDFCQQVLERNLKLKWTCNTRIDLVDAGLLSLMGRAGCRQINFGIEAADEKIRQQVVNKGSFSNQQIYQVFQACRQNKIKIAGYFMLGHPTETWTELQATQRMILNSSLEVLGLSIPTPFPGSRLYNLAAAEGLINKEIIDRFAKKELGQGYSGVYPVYISKNLSREDVFQEMKRINRKFYLRPRRFWQRLKEDFFSMSRLKQDVKDLWWLIKRGVSSRKPYVS